MNTQELFWKHAEGRCTAAEAARLQELLAADPELQAELDAVLLLQQELDALPAAGPSLRFSQNVMEALPPGLYPPLAEQNPLVRPVWKHLFWLAIGLATALAVTLLRQPTTAGEGTLPYAQQVADFVTGFTGHLSATTVQYSFMILLALLLLAGADKMLRLRRG